MAMLADNTKKQKWSTDPRNTAWSNDTNRFGYQLMTKMGWEKGKGLGAKEHGQTSHVKAFKRRNNQGLGADQTHDDNWLAHQDAFNDLLSHLNSVNQNDDGSNDGAVYDMEKRARESRRRVFYNRFIKSKDASSYSSTDMACILGQRSKSAPATPLDQSEDSDSGDSAASCPTQNTSTSHGVTTIRTGQSIQEYFAQKMQELKAARCKEPSERTSEGDGVGENVGQDGVNHGSESSDSSGRGEKKKAKKRKRQSGEEAMDERERKVKKKKRSEAKKEEMDGGEGGKVVMEQEQTKDKKNKKKKRKGQKKEDTVLTAEPEGIPKRNKKVKKKKKKREI